MGLLKKLEIDYSEENSTRSGTAEETESADRVDFPWRVLNNPIFAGRPEVCRSTSIPGVSGIRTSGVSRNRSEVKKATAAAKLPPKPAAINAVKRLQRSYTAPSTSTCTTARRKIPERRWRSRLRESERFRNVLAPLWKLLTLH
ncbi:hypothetical protein Mapa_006466 [Marchantia paleacea]|nr:hypothetical protein Mapa_006466 [Marchantia paleacea]